MHLSNLLFNKHYIRTHLNKFQDGFYTFSVNKKLRIIDYEGLCKCNNIVLFDTLYHSLLYHLVSSYTVKINPMKQFICLILLTLAFNVDGQIQNDKVLHFNAGAFLSSSATYVTYRITDNKWLSVATGFGCSVLAGFIKEDYDKKTGKGVYDPKDILWTTIGGAVGVNVIFTLKSKNNARSIRNN